MKLSVIIPVYNEVATIEEILRRVAAVPREKEILVVDDGSGDGTPALLERCRLPEMRLFNHPRNRGKGAAIRTALPHVSGDFVIIQDADLEYDPADYAKLLAPLERGEADVVYGSRFLGRGHHASSRWHYFVNRTLTQLSNLFTGLRLTDMETCYKAFRAELLRGLDLVSEGFEIEPEMTAKAARRGARFREVAISYRGRASHEGKKIGWGDGVRTLMTILRFGVFRRG
ncbi:MAG: glycosyltransferase family 2 protein [Candidatus Eisenbacteria sp.]|nr:glycosyltransferase family 2 protein [Candidatus Eisenbacteria bacterium]